MKAAIEENEKTKNPDQISFHIDDYDATKSDFQMDGVFESYKGRTSFVEKMFCRPCDDYPEVKLKDGTVCLTICSFRLSDYNEDFKFIMNVKTQEEEDAGIYSKDEKNLIPDYNVAYINFYDVWDRHSCKLFSSIAADSNREYIGNSQVDMIPIKYFKIKNTDKKFYIDFYNARNISCPNVIPYKYTRDDKSIMSEPFVIELQLMQNEKLLYI